MTWSKGTSEIKDGNTKDFKGFSQKATQFMWRSNDIKFPQKVSLAISKIGTLKDNA